MANNNDSGARTPVHRGWSWQSGQLEKRSSEKKGVGEGREGPRSTGRSGSERRDGREDRRTQRLLRNAQAKARQSPRIGLRRPHWKVDR
jgi:hypothetical protein